MENENLLKALIVGLLGYAVINHEYRNKRRWRTSPRLKRRDQGKDVLSQYKPTSSVPAINISMSWSRDQISVLLDEYERYPILYDTKHDLYYNRGARTGALQQILDEVIKIRPNTTIEMIKSKLNTLRTQFNKEINTFKKKQNSSETSYHHSSLWCFQRMLFLKDYLTPKNSSKYDLQLQLPAKKEHTQENRVDFSQNGESQHEHENIVHQEVYLATELIKDSQQVHENIGHQEQEFSSSTSSNESNSFRNNKKRKRSEHVTDIRSVLPNVVATKQNDDEWDVFTKFITSEIKTIKSERRKNRMKREIISLVIKNQEEEEEEEDEFEKN